MPPGREGGPPVCLGCMVCKSLQVLVSHVSHCDVGRVHCCAGTPCMIIDGAVSLNVSLCAGPP